MRFLVFIQSLMSGGVVADLENEFNTNLWQIHVIRGIGLNTHCKYKGHRVHSADAYIYIFSDLLVRNGQEFSSADVIYLGHTGKYEINMW